MPKSSAETTRDNVRKYREAGLIQAKIWVHPSDATAVRAYAAKQVLTETIRLGLNCRLQKKTAGQIYYGAGVPTEAWVELCVTSKRAWGKVAAKCAARQHSDQMVCNRCVLVWDMNDPSPPECEIKQETQKKMKDVTVEEHHEYPDWVVVTQINTFSGTVDTVHIKKRNLPELVKKLQELSK